MSMKQKQKMKINNINKTKKINKINKINIYKLVSNMFFKYYNNLRQ